MIKNIGKYLGWFLCFIFLFAGCKKREEMKQKEVVGIYKATVEETKKDFVIKVTDNEIFFDNEKVSGVVYDNFFCVDKMINGVITTYNFCSTKIVNNSIEFVIFIDDNDVISKLSVKAIKI